MADLFSLLVQSGYGLSAHSAALSTAGQNIANANTPGYARQIANLAANPSTAALGLNAVGNGVSLQSITQARDLFVERQIPNAVAARSRSQTESDALGALAALNPDLEGGMTSALGAFYASLRSLSQNPGDLALRQAAVGASRGLARALNQTAGSIEAARTGLDAKLQGKVNEINAAAASLADLNKQIQIAKTAGGQPNDLIDKRYQVIDQLASLTGATPYSNGAGDISMALPGGTVLVSDARAARFQAVPDPSNGGHLALRMVRSDGSGPVDFDGATLGGEMGGLFAARDGAMRTALTAVDTFAFDMATAVNTVHRAGYALDGTGNRDLFTIPLTSSGAATLIAVDAAVSADPRLLAAATTTPAASGDNRNILALLATEQQALAGGNDPVSSLQKIVGDFGTSTTQARALADHDGAMAEHLTKLRDATSGVSIDEEMINLTKAQRAFEAMSKVIAAADEMLDVLMQLK